MAKFEHEQAAITEQLGGLVDQTAVKLDARRAAEKCDVWFVVAHFAFERRFFMLPDVRRIADDYVESMWKRRGAFLGGHVFEERRQQIAFEKFEAIGDAGASGIAARDFESVGGDIGGEDFGVWELARERDRETAGTCADIGDDQSFARCAGIHVNFQATFAEAGECHFHNVLGFWAWNQHCGIYFEVEAPEFLFAGDVLGWFAGGAAIDAGEVFFCGGRIEQFFGMRINPGTIAANSVHQQNFRS